MVLAESQLPGRAQHAVGRHAAHLSPRDLETARQHGSDRSQRHVVAEVNVHRAADDLERTLSGVDYDEPHAVGALDRADLVDPGHDDVFETITNEIDAF